MCDKMRGEERITKRIEPAEAVELWEEMQGLEAAVERLEADNKRLRGWLIEVESYLEAYGPWDRELIEEIEEIRRHEKGVGGE